VGYQKKQGLKNKLLLYLYLVCLVTLSALRDPIALAGVLALQLALAGKDALGILKKSAALALVFSFFITASYSVSLYLANRPFVDYLLAINLRALSLSFMTLLFIARVNLFEAFSFSKELSFLLTLSVSKVVSIQKLFGDFTSALKSRTVSKPKPSEAYGYLGSAVAMFLDKSIAGSKENMDAMRSRGFGV
jgi:cobalt/nickel transport system permease protein